MTKYSPTYWNSRQFPKTHRLGNSILVLLGCPSERWDLGTTLRTTEELLMYEICRGSGFTSSSYSASKRSFVWPGAQMIAILGWFQAFRFVTSVFLTEWLVNFPSSNSNSAFKAIFFMKESVLLTTMLSFLYHTFDIVISPWAGRIFITKNTVLNALYVVFLVRNVTWTDDWTKPFVVELKKPQAPAAQGDWIW